MPDAMLPYQALPDLTAALAELADRERSGQPNYKLGCCLLFTHRAGLGEALAFYVDEHFTYLDQMTGDDCVVFVAARPRRPEPGSVRPGWEVSPDEADRLVVETARHLDIRFDALPCATFFVPARERSDRIVLRLARYFPRREHGYSNEDVDTASTPSPKRSGGRPRSRRTPGSTGSAVSSPTPTPVPSARRPTGGTTPWTGPRRSPRRPGSSAPSPRRPG
jgi:hypothetical protein